MRLVSILGEVIVAVRRIDVYEFIFISVAAVFCICTLNTILYFSLSLLKFPVSQFNLCVCVCVFSIYNNADLSRTIMYQTECCIVIFLRRILERQRERKRDRGRNR